MAIKDIVDGLIRAVGCVPVVDRTQRTLTDGSPVTDDHKQLGADGMQKGYVVLSDEERARGFVRPVRQSYRHVGTPGPRYPLRDVTTKEAERSNPNAEPYVKYEEYQRGSTFVVGRFWTQTGLDSVGKGCGTVTTMGMALAETYARDPSFYSGTFCCGCGKHLPVGDDGEFIWEGTTERVGT